MLITSNPGEVRKQEVVKKIRNSKGLSIYYTFEQAEDINYLLTNVEASLATPTWLIETYSQRNWLEVL